MIWNKYLFHIQFLAVVVKVIQSNLWKIYVILYIFEALFLSALCFGYRIKTFLPFFKKCIKSNIFQANVPFLFKRFLKALW